MIENGELSFAGAYGEAKSSIPATPATLYNIASLTKPISAEVALQLAAKNHISLDENMSNYWTDPDISSDARRNLLTPRIALAHQTGFPNWRSGTLTFKNTPGEIFGYSGEGFEYLAKFIHNKTDRSIDDWANQLIFEPNGMRHTTYTHTSWLDNRIALPHDADGTELIPQVATSAIASDDMFSTPSDYALFITSILNKEGMTETLYKERTSIQTDRKASLCQKLTKHDCPNQVGMALGWELFIINDKTYFMHTGSDKGTFTFAYFSPTTQTGAVIFTNSSNGSKAVLPILHMTKKNADFVEFLEKLVSA